MSSGRWPTRGVFSEVLKLFYFLVTFSAAFGFYALGLAFLLFLVALLEPRVFVRDLAFVLMVTSAFYEPLLVDIFVCGAFSL